MQRRAWLLAMLALGGCSVEAPRGAREMTRESRAAFTSEHIHWSLRAPSSDTIAWRGFLFARPAVAYDSSRNVLVRFGGVLPDSMAASAQTREWDGVHWATRDAPGPAARMGHAMAYDSLRHVVVMFGGLDAAAIADTWEWDGMSWLSRHPTTSPPPSYGHAMAFDRARGRVVLVGGQAGSGSLPSTDTWEWTGDDWVLRTPSHRPPGRSLATLTYDEARGVSVMFGGRDSDDATWEWDGDDWRLATPLARPTPRVGHCGAYDPVRKRVIVFYGDPPSGGTIPTDAWEYDGITWRRALADQRPHDSAQCSAAWATAEGRVAMLTEGEDVWLWDGATFSERRGEALALRRFRPTRIACM